MRKIKRGKRIECQPIDDAALIYVSSAHEKYGKMITYFKKHPHKFVEYYTGTKLSLWQRLCIALISKIKKSDYEKQQDAINKAIKPYIRKETR